MASLLCNACPSTDILLHSRQLRTRKLRNFRLGNTWKDELRVYQLESIRKKSTNIIKQTHILIQKFRVSELSRKYHLYMWTQHSIWCKTMLLTFLSPRNSETPYISDVETHRKVRFEFPNWKVSESTNRKCNTIKCTHILTMSFWVVLNLASVSAL